MRTYKKNELAVLDLLNQMKGSDFKMAEGEYSSYDIYGYSEGVKTLVEVKGRKDFYHRPYIETQKIIDMGKVSKANEEPIDMFLVVGMKGKQYVYNLKDVYKNGTHTTSMAPVNTKFGNQTKIEKKVIEFPWDSFMVELTTMEVGKDYEVVC